MKTKTMFVLMVMSALAFCLAISQPAIAASDEDEVLQVAANFSEAFNDADFELMTSLYWHSPKLSEFTPSPAGAFLAQGWDGIGTGWKTTFELPAGTYMTSTHNQQATMLRNDVGMVTQYMIITYTDPATKAQEVHQVRQTLVIQKIGGKWVIVHHHSSEFPTE